MHQIFDSGGGRFFVSRSLGDIGILCDTRADAEAARDRINAAVALDARKNAALDWALANGVPDDEITAAIDDHCGTGLLAFEDRMADGPSPLAGALKHPLIMDAIDRANYGAPWHRAACEVGETEPVPHIAGDQK